MKLVGSYSFISLFLCFLSLRILAQDANPGGGGGNEPTGKIMGKLIDTKKKPVSYATVTLLRIDSTVVNGDLSKEDGSFTIAPTGFGNFILRVNAIGIETQYIPNLTVSTSIPDKKMGDVVLKVSENTLKAVEVTGEKAMIQMNIDKKVFNVDKNITTSGGSAADVLQNVPSVSVDANGNVSLRGKTDVTILIDGKPATLLGGDIQSALQSLPASSIDNVEVITNPSAKYDAQGLTGIINIITKKDKRLGINGNVTLGIGSNGKYNGNLGLNMRRGKWNVFINTSFRMNHNDNKTITNRLNVNGSSSYNFEEDPRDFKGFFNTFGTTFDWNSHNSITFTQNVNVMDHSYTDFSYYSTYDSAGASSGLTTRLSSASGGPLSYSSSLDYKHKFNKKEEELTMNATYSNASYQREQEYNTTIYSSIGSGSYGPIVETAPTDGSNGSFIASADYVNPIKTGKLGLGVKTQLVWFYTKNNPLIDSPDRAPNIVDYTLLNDFTYKQQIHAAYVNWNDVKNKFSYQLGLRAEDYVYDAVDYVPTELKFSNSSFGLFPSAYISYQLPEQQTIYLNYTRRTNRPTFWNMLPFKDVSNPGIVQQGNPDLEPEFINNIEFTYNKLSPRGDNIILSTYFQYTQNLIERVSSIIAESDSGLAGYAGRQFIQPINLASGITYGAEVTAHLQLIPIWDATFNFNVFQTRIKIGETKPGVQAFVNDRGGLSGIGKINTSLKLPGNFSFQLNFQYESPKIIAQGHMQETSWVDMAIRKAFWKNRINVVLNVSDVFDTRKYTSIYEVDGAYYETYVRARETRVANFSITYRFGKSSTDKYIPDSAPAGGKKKSKTTGQPTQKERENNLKENDDNADQTTPAPAAPTTPTKETNKNTGTH